MNELSSTNIAGLATFDLGKTITIDYKVVNSATGLPVDPLVVQFLYQVGSTGSVVSSIFNTDPQIQHIDVGHYQISLVLNEPGFWQFRWKATEPADGEDGLFFVEPALTLPS